MGGKRESYSHDDLESHQEKKKKKTFVLIVTNNATETGMNCNMPGIMPGTHPTQTHLDVVLFKLIEHVARLNDVCEFLFQMKEGEEGSAE